MATLKISDISIGDYISYCDRVYKVHSIDGQCLVGASNDSYSSPHILKHIDYLEPIPITAEILEANGFGQKTYTQDQLLRIVEPNGNRPFVGYRWDSRRVIIERNNDYMLRVKAEYVHQLQHALRLAGVDKEINL